MTLSRVTMAMLALAAGCAAVPPPAEPAKVAPAKPAVPAKSPPAAAPTRPAAPRVAAQPSPRAAPAMDLKTLEQRLKQTDAIGVLTKLSLKNQLDDLVARFRAFHDGHRPPSLAELRPSFELLLMKVLALLQDHDRALADDINAARDAMWSVLTDREKLAKSL